MALEALSGLESDWLVTSLFLLILMPILALFNDDLK